MANDIDIIVGVRDLATSVLDRLSSKVNSIGGSAKDAFAGAAERLNDQLARVSSGAGGLGNEKIAKAIETAANGLSTKLDAAVAKTNASIDSITGRVQNAISAVSGFVTKAAAIASIGAAFVTVGRGVWGATGSLADFVLGSNKAEVSTQKLKTGILSSLAPFSRYVVAAGATVALTNATLKATSATSGLVEKTLAVGRGALAAFVLRNALKKTEDGASTLGAKLAKVAGFALAFDVAARASVRFGISLLGIGAKAQVATTALTKTANISARIASAPMKALAGGASAAALSTTHLASSIDELPKGAQSINTLVSGFGDFAAQIGGIPGLLLAIPAGIAGIAFAAVMAASKTERQITQLTNKLKLVEAARLNINIEEIDASPLRKIAEETAEVAKRIQTATNVQASKLVSLATNNLPKGLDPSQISDALKSSVGLAEVYGTSIEDGMYRTRQAIEGNFESFEKLIPSIATMATNQEKLAAVSKLAANGFKVMHSETLTFWGTIERVRNGLGNVLESLGRMQSLSDLVGTVLRDVVTPAVEFLDSKLKGFGFDGSTVLDSAIALGAGFVATFDTIGSNWDKVMARMATGSELFWVQLKSHTENFVNDTLPWLGDNFVGVMEHAWAKIQKGYTSGWGKAVLGAQEMIGLAPKGSVAKDIVGGIFGKKDTYTPTALPEMKGRNISDKETEVQSRLDKIDSEILGSIKGNYQTAFDSINDMVKKQNLGVDPKINLQAKPPVATPVEASLAKNKIDTATNQVLQSRFLARGTSGDPQREMAGTLRRQEALMQKQLALLEKNPRVQPAKLEVEVIT